MTPSFDGVLDSPIAMASNDAHRDAYHGNETRRLIDTRMLTERWALTLRVRRCTT